MIEQFIKFRNTLQNIEEMLTNLIVYKEKNSLTFFGSFTEIGKLKTIRYTVRTAIESINELLENNFSNYQQIKNNTV